MKSRANAFRFEWRGAAAENLRFEFPMDAGDSLATRVNRGEARVPVPPDRNTDADPSRIPRGGASLLEEWRNTTVVCVAPALAPRGRAVPPLMTAIQNAIRQVFHRVKHSETSRRPRCYSNLGIIATSAGLRPPRGLSRSASVSRIGLRNV